MDWKKLLFPPLWVLVLLTIVSAGALVAVFVLGWEQTVLAYIVYGLSFYTLCTVSLFCVMVLPKQYRQIKRRLLSIPLIHRLVTDTPFRTKLSLHASLGVNLLYVAIHLITWYLQRSWWFVCLAVYHGILSVMRFLLVRYVRLNDIGSNRRGELKRAISCSCVMLLLNLFLTGAVLMVVYQGKGFSYGGILIYVMALFVFYNITFAILDLVKYRGFESPVLSTAKVVSLAAALVSMLNLETAMFAQFGADMALRHQNLMIMLTGGGISVTVILLAGYIILRSIKEFNKLRYQQNG